MVGEFNITKITQVSMGKCRIIKLLKTHSTTKLLDYNTKDCKTKIENLTFVRLWHIFQTWISFLITVNFK